MMRATLLLVIPPSFVGRKLSRGRASAAASAPILRRALQKSVHAPVQVAPAPARGAPFLPLPLTFALSYLLTPARRRGVTRTRLLLTSTAPPVVPLDALDAQDPRHAPAGRPARALRQTPEVCEVVLQLLLRVVPEEARDGAPRPPARRVVAAHDAQKGGARGRLREDGLTVRVYVAAYRAPHDAPVGREDDDLGLPFHVDVESRLRRPAEGAPPRAPHVEDAARPTRRGLEVGEDVEDEFDGRVDLDETLVPSHNAPGQ